MRKLLSVLSRQRLIGLRTAKTVVAVLATSLFMTHVLDQNPFFACIGAVVAMEKTISISIRASIVRNIATITGGLIGIVIGSLTENVVLMALGLIPLIWVNNWIGRKESIVPGAIVYFAVFYLNTMEQAWVYGLTRIVGTLFGTVIALTINAVVFPPEGQAKQSY